jgi:hypothetical protein
MLNENPRRPKPAYEARVVHYISYLGVSFDMHPRQILDKIALGIYEFGPESNQQLWTYLTSGMSEKGQGLSSEKVFTELLFYSKDQSVWAIDLLMKLSTYPFEYSETFSPGDTLPLAGPIRPGSKLTSLLLLEPFLENPNFRYMDVLGKQVDILWVLPITEKELELIISSDNLNFNKMISREQLPDLLDLNRDTLLGT